MKLPVKFKLGITQYTVMQPKTLTKKRIGVTYLEDGIVKVATHWEKTPRPEYGVLGQHETFWHEVTHAILYEMGNALWTDETFVTAFARKLAQVIETSEFK